MRIKQDNSDKDFAKMPKIVIHFMCCYVGGFGLVNVMDAVNGEYMLIKIITVTVCSVVFAYGFISLKEDYKKGGFDEILKKFNPKE